MKVVTIGAYGFTADAFFKALEEARVDTFVDIRLRRGVRGREYSFVNSTKLQEALTARGIRYAHVKELAPSKETRAKQKQADIATATAKRDRSELSPAFVEAYQTQCLDPYSPAQFRSVVGETAKVVALFCVEGKPGACHRSLVAGFLREHGVTEDVEHLLP